MSSSAPASPIPASPGARPWIASRFPEPLREPGQGLAELVDRKVERDFEPYVLVAFCLLVVGLWEWLAEALRLPRMPWLYVALAVPALLLAGMQFFRVKKTVARYQQGRRGERAVGQFLETLRSYGAQIFHDIPMRGSSRFNLDHVVVSNRGVLVVETKTWGQPKATPIRVSMSRDAIYRNGVAPSGDPVQQVQGYVKELDLLLRSLTGKTLPIKGVLVFPGCHIQRMTDAWKRSAHLPWVLNRTGLVEFFKRQPQCISEDEARGVADAMARYINAGSR